MNYLSLFKYNYYKIKTNEMKLILFLTVRARKIMTRTYLVQILDEFWKIEKKVAILNVILPFVDEWHREISTSLSRKVGRGLDDLQNGVDGDVTTMCFVRRHHRWERKA